MQNHATQTGSDQASFVRQLFSDRHIGAMLVLGFSSGIPFLLVYVTQSAWLSEAKVPISILGLMSELTLAYSSSSCGRLSSIATTLHFSVAFWVAGVDGSSSRKSG